MIGRVVSLYDTHLAKMVKKAFPGLRVALGVHSGQDTETVFLLRASPYIKPRQSNAHSNSTARRWNEPIGSTVLCVLVYDRSVVTAEIMTIHAEPVLKGVQACILSWWSPVCTRDR